MIYCARPSPLEPRSCALVAPWSEDTPSTGQQNLPAGTKSASFGSVSRMGFCGSLKTEQNNTDVGAGSG